VWGGVSWLEGRAKFLDVPGQDSAAAHRAGKITASRGSRVAELVWEEGLAAATVELERERAPSLVASIHLHGACSEMGGARSHVADQAMCMVLSTGVRQTTVQ